MTLATVAFAGDIELIKIHEQTVKLAFKRRVFTFTRLVLVLKFELKSCVMKHSQVSKKLMAKFKPDRARNNKFITILVFNLIRWRWHSFTSTLIFSTSMAESCCKLVQLLNENRPIGFCWSHFYCKKAEIFPILGDVIIAKWKKELQTVYAMTLDMCLLNFNVIHR